MCNRTNLFIVTLKKINHKNNGKIVKYVLSYQDREIIFNLTYLIPSYIFAFHVSLKSLAFTVSFSFMDILTTDFLKNGFLTVFSCMYRDNNCKSDSFC